MSEITFTCEKHFDGVIAKPVPAKKIIEDWYRKLPMDYPLDSGVVPESFNKTVKSCPPFLDAMTLGWMILAPADFKLEVIHNSGHFDASWRIPAPYIEAHHPFNLVGHTKEGRAIIKIFTMWAVSTPPGWSVLVFPPLNRSELPVEAMSGVLDTDRWHDHLSIPCFLNLPDGIHMIHKGTPIAQIVPFRREPVEAVIRAETDDEKEIRDKARLMLLSEIGSYHRNLRAKDR